MIFKLTKLHFIQYSKHTVYQDTNPSDLKEFTHLFNMKKSKK
jgi:hypothetical protein